jgi:hypothetical protein
MRLATFAALLCAAGLAAGCSSAPAGGNLRFQLSFPPTAHAAPITGRVFVFISRRATPEPRLEPSGYTGDTPFFATDVHALAPGAPAVIDGSARGFPLAHLDQLPAGDYYVQGLMNVYTEFHRSDGHTVWLHMDHWEGQHLATSPGNLVSAVQRVHLDPARPQTVTLALDRVLPPVVMPRDTPWVKHIKIQSPMLTRFWGHAMYLGATVLLPKGYDQHPHRLYPVVYVQGHFTLRPPYGFTPHPTPPNPRRAAFLKVLGIEDGYQFYQAWNAPGFPRMILVTLQHPTPYYDDSYAVNSVNDGPYGDAILQELIPYVETHFRIDRKPSARMLTGGSTGGWESLDLMVKHPGFFGGTWTFYPDPLDFHHFQSVNLYRDTNAFVAPGSDPWLPAPRYMMREPDGQPLVTYRQMSQDEAALGTHGRSGEQLDIFFATFGPIGADGYPVPLWNLHTGAINPRAVAYARAHGYDITAYLKQNWPALGPKLVNKIHVYVGDMDSFYLNLGVYGLQQFMESTRNPHYAGTFVYGRPEKPHGWNGGMTNAELMRRIYAAVRP